MPAAITAALYRKADAACPHPFPSSSNCSRSNASRTTCSAARAATSAPSTCSADRCSGQALSAAQATLESRARAAHSLHAYFLRAGDIEHPIVYSVDRTRDGGSFSVRRVTAIQHGQADLLPRRIVPEGRTRRRTPAVDARGPQARGHRTVAGDLPPKYSPSCRPRCSAGCRGWGRSNSATSIRATNSIRPSGRRSSRCGSGCPNAWAMRRNCIARCSPTLATSTCSARRPFRTASATTSRTCRWHRWTMRCGSTARSARTNGCCIRSTAPARRAAADWRAA